MVDMVEFQDTASPGGISFPPGCVPGTSCCDPGFSLNGVCLTFKNQTSSTVASAKVTVSPWQCFNPIIPIISVYTDPVTGEYEGEHCNNTSLIIPCASADVDLTLPPGGLGPFAQTMAQIDFETNVTLRSCLLSTFIGVDVTFREPTASDQAAGMRSAKIGPFVVDPVTGNLTTFQGIYPIYDPATKTNSAGRVIRDFLIYDAE
jgi:hypothetical protein